MNNLRYVLDLHDSGYWLVFDLQEKVKYPAGYDKEKTVSLIQKLNETPSEVWVNKERRHLLISWSGEPATVEIAPIF